MKAVFNSSPIIFLGKLNFINEAVSLFKTIYVPAGVIEEISAKKEGNHDIAQTFIKHSNVIVKAVEEDGFYIKLRDNLGKGETEAILLAFDNNEPNDYIILDDKAARHKAQSLGLRVKGTLGILRILYLNGLIALHPEQLFDKLKGYDFRVSKNIYKEIMKEFYNN